METTTPKPFAFVLMPFSKEFDDIYELGIKAACTAAGAFCQRVDEQIFTENILERVYNQISKADIIIAEMTGRNPNVFYETGYAHALNKRVILLTQKAEDIPFDLKQYPHIVYNNSIRLLKDQLEAQVRWSIENPRDSLQQHDFNLDVYINEQRYTQDSIIEVRAQTSSGDYHTKTGQAKRGLTSISAYLVLGLHNTNNQTYLGGSTIGFICPQYISSVIFSDQSHKDKFLHRIQLDAQHSLFTLDNIQIPKILPNAWSVLIYQLKIYRPTDDENNLESLLDINHAITIRIFTELGPRDYPLNIRLATN